MKTIAIDIREAISKNPAGKGIYNLEVTLRLIKDTSTRWILLSDNPSDIFKETENVKILVIKSKGMGWHWKVRQYLSNNPVDHYLAMTSFLTPCLLKNIKFSIVVHDLIVFLHPQKHNLKAKIIEKLTLKRAATKAENIFTVSANTKNDLINLIPKIDQSKICVTHCGVNTEFFNPNLDSTNQTPFILTVSTIIPRKNILNLIKAFELIAEKFKYDLVIAGGKGPNSDEIFTYAAKSKFKERIKFKGYASRNELKILYQNAELFVYPSIYEGFGIPVLEALACGCKVACSNNSSLPEVADQFAWMFDPYSYEQIAEKMTESLSSNPKAGSIDHAAKFTWTKVADKIAGRLAK